MLYDDIGVTLIVNSSLVSGSYSIILSFVIMWSPFFLSTDISTEILQEVFLLVWFFFFFSLSLNLLLRHHVFHIWSQDSGPFNDFT